MTTGEPFQRKPIEAREPVKGVKLKNKVPIENPKQQAQEDFEKRADAFVEKQQGRNSLAIDLARQFLEQVHSKVLTVNKTNINTEIETEIKNKLISLLIEINNDENEQQDGMGSATIISLILKSVFIQRDIINDLSYEVSELKKELSSLDKQGVVNVK